ncbi:MAG: TolC family protein [Polyangiales bacterium]
MLRVLVLIVTSVVLFPALPLRAQPIEPGALRLEEALTLAEERSPSVQIARAGVRAAASYMEIGTQTRARAPIVSLRAMIGRPDAPAATYSAMLGIPFDATKRQPVFRREAALLLERAEAEYQAAVNDARARALSAYVAAAVAQAQVEVQTDRAEVTQGILDSVAARLAQQASTAYDLSLAEREVAEARAAVIAANERLEAARGELRMALDLPPNAVPVVETLAAPSLPAGLDVEAIVALAAERRREPVAFQLAAERYRVSERRIRAEAVSPAFVGLEYEAQGNQSPQQSIGASFSFQLPLVFSNQGERAVARASAVATDVEAEVTLRNVQREAATAYRLLALHLSELRMLEESALPAAQRAVEMTEARRAAGSADLFQVLINRRDFYALRARRTDALGEAWLARVALERAVGGRLP